MSWGRVDDNMPEHPKWVALEEEHGARVWADAMALWLCVSCYANRNDTDGAIRASVLKRLCPLSERAAMRAAEAMVSVELLDRIDGGFRIHNFLEYNDSAERKRLKRAADAARKRPVGVDSDTDSARNPNGDESESSRTDPGIQALPYARDRAPAPASRPVPSHPIPDRSGEADPGLVARAPVSAPRRSRSTSKRETPLEPVETARRLVMRGYGERFELALGEPWMGASAVAQAIDTIAAWCVAAARGGALEPVVDRLLDGAFASERLRENRWPLRWVAEDPGRYATAPSAPGRFDHVPADHVPQLATYDDEVTDAPV